MIQDPYAKVGISKVGGSSRIHRVVNDLFALGASLYRVARASKVWGKWWLRVLQFSDM